MSTIPLPKVPLGSHCSAIRNNTLYTFSENAFQSLELTNGSEWRTLPRNIGTRGAACVLAHRGTANEALYIVGGSTTNASLVPEKGFMGLQRWVFRTRKWETVLLPDPVTYNITNHGATFLESTQRLIVFAGTAYPTVDVPSANTFLIQTEQPHEITSLPAQKALLAPVVLQWGGDGALVVGGDASNMQLNTYTTSGGWASLSAELKKAMPPRGKASASLMDGDDGSRMLMTFDMTTSPATVGLKRVVDPASKTKRAGASPAVSTESQLTADNWPEYDGEGAPTGTREGTSLAYDGDMVVISGGNDDEPLLMFNTRKNSWLSAQSVLAAVDDEEPEFRSESEDPISTSSTITTATPKSSTLSTPSASSTADAAPAAAAAATDPSSSTGLNTVKLLFIILGSLLGAILILALIFLFLKRRRLARESKSAARSCKGNPHDNERMSFQDRGASFMKEAGGSISFPHRNRSANNSWVNVTRQATLRHTDRRPSQLHDGPTVHRVGGQGIIVHPGQTPTPPPSDRNAVIPALAASKERGSGWSRYFSGNSATNLVATPQRTFSSHSSVYSNRNSHLNQTMGVPSIQRNDRTIYSHGENRGSDISLSSIGGDSFSSGIPESIDGPPVWSQLEEGEGRGNVTSSVYDSGVDSLSWLNLRQS